MTNEKAIKKIKSLCHGCVEFPHCVNTDPDCFKALEMAIKALEQEPCEDCISKEFIEIVVNYPQYSIKYRENGKEYVGFGTYKIEILSQWIKEHFISNIQPKTGHWFYDKSIENWRCSECKETPKTMGYCGSANFMTEHFKFCNHCGAKMVEPQESEDKHIAERGTE